MRTFAAEKITSMRSNILHICSKTSKFLLLAAAFIVFISCEQQEKKLTAQQIIDKAIENAGGEKYKKADIEFQFREAYYTSSRNNGYYTFTRTIKDSIGEAKDVLNNEGFTRYRGESIEKLHDTLTTAFSESVNAVHYFVQLPYGLNDAAVNKELLGVDQVEGEPYYEIRVTFEQEGGGADHEDEYLYWIHKDNFTVDYLAYRFFVNDGGIRFREAYNPRTKKGIRFVDYENYKTDDLSTPLEELDELFEAGKLLKVSTIENEIKKVEVQE